MLIVLDEADRLLLDATLAIVDAECKASGAEPLDEELVERWMGHRNDVSALAPLYRAGIVVDTVEVSGRWSILADLYSSCLNSLRAVEGTLVASAHQSHAYTDGACIYLTFAGRMPEGESSKDPDTWAESYYASAWQSVMDTVIGAGGTISHHHGIGINRSRFMGPALGKASLLLESIKGVLDPRGILNPGKLGIPADSVRSAGLETHVRSLPEMSVLVVDVGSSSVRASIVDPDAGVTHVHSEPVEVSSPAPSFIEGDAASVAVSVLSTARKTLDAARVDGVGIDAVGIANQRTTTVVWDRKSGEPVGPSISWQDLRTVGMCLMLREQGIYLTPTESATKLAFLLDLADPERSKDLCFGTMDTWVAWTLSSGDLHVTDATNAAVTGLRTLDGLTWDERILDAVNIPARCAA